MDWRPDRTVPPPVVVRSAAENVRFSPPVDGRHSVISTATSTPTGVRSSPPLRPLLVSGQKSDEANDKINRKSVCLRPRSSTNLPPITAGLRQDGRRASRVRLDRFLGDPASITRRALVLLLPARLGAMIVASPFGRSIRSHVTNRK